MCRGNGSGGDNVNVCVSVRGAPADDTTRLECVSRVNGANVVRYGSDCAASCRAKGLIGKGEGSRAARGGTFVAKGSNEDMKEDSADGARCLVAFVRCGSPALKSSLSRGQTSTSIRYS